MTDQKRYVVWFSCGAASAVAAMLILKEQPDAVLVYCDTGSEHEDNKRFLSDCEKWLNKPITILKNEKYRDTWQVFEKERYLAGVKGAKCTTELKKKVRQRFEDLETDIQIFGFDTTEIKRAERFKINNPEMNVRFPLIEHGLSKMECLDILKSANIEIPVMYKLGYHNNNCIGCVKGGAGYWNKIRRDFPEVFNRMAQVERSLNAAICKKLDFNGKRVKVFLDELPPDAGKYEDLKFECSLFCG